MNTYAWFCGVFLLLQGSSTLLARLIPEVDRTFPWLLRATQMVPAHSALHIATALLALSVLLLGARPTWWFAVLFGSFYFGLGVLGLVRGTGGPDDFCGLTTGLGLRAFDHPFHVLLGLLGIVAAWATRQRSAAPARTVVDHPPVKEQP